jgi:diguanylate cyclase (GGDEF)-like protein
MSARNRRMDARKHRAAPADTRVARDALSAKATALAARELELEKLNGWFHLALNNMARGLSMFDAEGRLIVCNKTYQEIYELPDNLTRTGTSLSDLARYHHFRETGRDSPRDRAEQRKWVERHISELSEGKTFTYTQHLNNGRVVLVTNKPLPGGGWVDVQEDITERRKAEQKINWLARHDPLTEVFNRMAFREALDLALTSLRESGGLAIHWIDLDHFKHINDSLGHPVGDALLKSVVKRLNACIREGDVIARLGGDEFVIIQPGAEGWSAAEQLAKRILAEIAKPHFVIGHTVACTATIGVTLAPQHSRSADELMKFADIALYNAKAGGRNKFAFFVPGSERGSTAPIGLADELDLALEKKELELHYQPIVDSRSRSVIAFEALMRWKHPDRGQIPPSEFIPIAEASGSIVELGAWALRRACHDASGWPADVRVNVNLSPVQFERGNIYESVANALKLSGLHPQRLELEITEGVLLRDEAATANALHSLRSLGVRVALDDFGTAYASLSYLRRFPFDKLKIDRSFVRDLDCSKRSDTKAIISAVSALARHLRMRTVVEGVETQEHVDTILGLGCDELQGYFFSKPVSSKDVQGVIAKCRDMHAPQLTASRSRAHKSRKQSA